MIHVVPLCTDGLPKYLLEALLETGIDLATENQFKSVLEWILGNFDGLQHKLAWLA